MTKDEFWTNGELSLGLLDKLYFRPDNLECTIVDIDFITGIITLSYFHHLANDFAKDYISGLELNLYDRI